MPITKQTTTPPTNNPPNPGGRKGSKSNTRETAQIIQLKIVLSSLNMSLSTALTAPSRPSMMASPILLSSLSHHEEPELPPGLPVSGVEMLPPGLSVGAGVELGDGVGAACGS
jgi:hypothetical protein